MTTGQMKVNGQAVSAEVEDRTLLADLLRDQLGLTGPGSLKQLENDGVNPIA